jgi:hypothetical protein
MLSPFVGFSDTTRMSLRDGCVNLYDYVFNICEAIGFNIPVERIIRGTEIENSVYSEVRSRGGCADY